MIRAVACLSHGADAIASYGLLLFVGLQSSAFTSAAFSGPFLLSADGERCGNR